MSFLTSLVNVVNVPILMVGTMKALPMMTSCFRTARRGEGAGSIVFAPLPFDEEWATFVRSLFKFQWTTQTTTLTEELSMALWEQSQGIIDIALKLFVLSQMRAIRLGLRGKPEVITTGLIATVAKESLKLVQPMLDALRRKDWKALESYEDLSGLDAMIATSLQREWKGAIRHPDLSTLASDVAAKIEGPDGEVANELMAAALAANGMKAADMRAVMEIVERSRASADSTANIVSTMETPRKVAPRRNRSQNAVLSDPSDLRVVASEGDPMEKLASAGLLDRP